MVSKCTKSVKSSVIQSCQICERGEICFGGGKPYIAAPGTADAILRDVFDGIEDAAGVFNQWDLADFVGCRGRNWS